MAKQIVTVTFAYEAETPEEAERQVQEIEDRYEGPSVVAAASSLGELPHPSQSSEAREIFGD